MLFFFLQRQIAFLLNSDEVRQYLFTWRERAGVIVREANYTASLAKGYLVPCFIILHKSCIRHVSGKRWGVWRRRKTTQP